MAGPNYALPAVRSARIAVQLLRLLCKSADLIHKHIKASSLPDAVKDAEDTFHDSCHTFCNVVEVAYAALPD